MNHNRKLGAWGERVAESLLESKGYLLLHRNYRCRYGETDLIMMDGGSIVFVEVKTRSQGDYGAPADAIGADKQRHMKLCAQQYLRDNGLWGCDVRFDYVSLLVEHSEGIL